MAFEELSQETSSTDWSHAQWPQMGRAVEKATALHQHALSTRAGCECVSHALQTLCDRAKEEQGDALMPLLYSIGQHQALDEVVRGLLPTEKLFAYLDDVYVVTTPDRVATVYTLLQENLWVVAGVRINSGKTQVWNAAGRKPLVYEAMDRIAQAQNPEAKVWRGSEVPVDRQGVKDLGAPIGHPAFVTAQLAAVAEHQATLLQRIPLTPDLQSAWLLLLHCAGGRPTYFLRVVNPEAALDYATLHDERVWSCLCRLFVGHFSQFVRLCGEAVRDAPSRARWSGFEKCSSNKAPCPLGLVGRLPPHDQSTPSRSGCVNGGRVSAIDFGQFRLRPIFGC